MAGGQDHESRRRADTLHHRAGDECAGELPEAGREVEDAEAGDNMVAANNVVGVADAHRLVHGAQAADRRGERHDQPEVVDAERDQRREQGLRRSDAGLEAAQQCPPVEPVGDGARQQAEDQHRKVVERQRDADPGGRLRRLEDQDAEHDMLAAHARVVERHTTRQTAKVGVAECRVGNDRTDQRHAAETFRRAAGLRCVCWHRHSRSSKDFDLIVASTPVQPHEARDLGPPLALSSKPCTAFGVAWPIRRVSRCAM